MAKNTVNEKIPTVFESYHVGIAAEGFAAGLLAHAGYNVLVQYGANQPLYDLVAMKKDRVLKISVKGTQLKGWALTGHLKNGRSYAEAADAWLENQGVDLVFMFVQFCGVQLGAMPPVYVARAHEVAEHLKAVRGSKGDTTLRWNHLWKNGCAKGSTDTVPDHWAFSRMRVDMV
jgi:hypothetical protein